MTITPRQLELFRFIENQIRTTGFAPSFDEMKVAVGVAHKSQVHSLLLGLEQRGYIKRIPHRHRGIEILKLPDEAHPFCPRCGANLHVREDA